MAKQKVVWTVLPYGFVGREQEPYAGALRASIVVSPRLIPETSGEQTLAAFPEFLDWPAVVNALEFVLVYQDGGGATYKIPVKLLSAPSSTRWNEVFRSTTLVDGFTFTDMSQVNLRSYSVRNVLRFVRQKYEKLATTAGDNRPRLLPWRNADPALKDLVVGLGGDPFRAREGGGFDRFLDFRNKDGVERQLSRRIFSKRGELLPDPSKFVGAFVVDIDGSKTGSQNPVRALPPDFDQSVNVGFRTAAEYDFYQANRFYTRPENRTAYEDRPSLANVEPPPKPPVLDFHRIVASLSDYPQLLRELGLVIDVAMPKDSATNPLLAALASSPTSRLDGSLMLLPQQGVPHNYRLDACPRTAFALTRERFLTRPRTTEIEGGLLALGGANDRFENVKSDYDVYQVDPDGAALKTSDFLLTAQRLVLNSQSGSGDGKVTYTTGDRQGVAALRSGSIGVSCHGRAGRVALLAASAALKNAAFESTGRKSSEVLLFAEDILRGYRVDVFTASKGKWNSLCWRVGEYKLANASFKPDEGYVKGPSTTSKEGTEDHYLHESLFRWAGWSLVAPRPGRAIVAGQGAGPGLQSETVAKVDDVAPQNTGVVVRFNAAVGSLPKLRFGERYRVRARVVDLAGNSLAIDDRSLETYEQATDEVRYLRFEPVDPPALVQRDRLSEGESLERLVIRSNYDTDATDFLTSAAFSAAIALPASAGFDYVPNSVRHVVPPKGAQLQAEMHGLLDAAFSGDVTNDARAAKARSIYEVVAEREPLSLFNVPSIELVTPPSVTNATSTTLPLDLPKPGKPTGDRLAGGQYVIYPDRPTSRVLPTPYLPDDASCGVALRRVPGATRPIPLGPGAAIVRAPNEELVVMVVFSGKWPDRTGLRIVTRELTTAIDPDTYEETPSRDPTPTWDADKRELTIYVPKGRIARLRYSSFVFTEDLANLGLKPDVPIDYLATLGIPAWVSNADARRRVQALAAVGSHWMITPDRPLVMVHATQQPVCSPRFMALSPSRNVGDTHADLSARLLMHGPSTSKFEIVADWTEVVDDHQSGPPKRLEGSGQLSEVPLPENYRNLFGLEEVIVLNEQAATETLANPPPAPPTPQSQRARGNRHQFGDTKFRLVRYRIRATTRYREYLPASLSDDTANITRIGDPLPGELVERGSTQDLAAPVLLNTPAATREGFIVVPNSARPISPAVVYVMPTVLWGRDLGAEKPKQTSNRYGNGLRIYLKRPWFSSGDGELLGVVILGDHKKFKDISDPMRPYVTQWGMDPLFESELPDEQTRINHFKLRVCSEDVLLEETGSTATVVGHRVHWDADRNLWYCDIELDPGRNYMPFVRLALVRYQPNSLDKAKVSRVVLAEFAQLLPRRQVVLSRQGSAAQLEVRGPAPEYGPTLSWTESMYADRSQFTPRFLPPQVPGRNRVEVVLQIADPSMDRNEPLAWSDASVLADGVLDPPDANAPPPPASTPTQPVRPGVAIGDRIRLGGRVSLRERIDIDRNLGDLLYLSDPKLWEGSVTLPNVDKPSRLVLREFERYYGDETTQAADGLRPVVQERLVYVETFPLN